MAKVLLVDTNFSSGPIHDAIARMGHDVHVVGNRPDDFLARMSGHYWKMDYSDTDALSALVERESFDALVPGCTDRSYQSCAAINHGRFPGIDSAEAYHALMDKAAFRQLAKQLGLPVPRRLTLQEACSLDDHAIIVKPVDAYSGHGISIVRQEGKVALDAALDKAREASASGRALIEEFVEGQLHSHSAFLQGGKVVRDFLVREDSSVNPFAVDTSMLLRKVPDGLLQNLRQWIERMAAHLSLVDGLLHTQFILADGKAWLIEITRRCPGDLYSRLIELTCGFDYPHAYASGFLGEPPSSVPPGNRLDPVLRHTVTLDESRGLAYIRFTCAVQIESWTPLSVAGETLHPRPDSRAGILFCRADDFDGLDAIYQKALRRSLYEVHG